LPPDASFPEQAARAMVANRIAIFFIETSLITRGSALCGYANIRRRSGDLYLTG
jgi:hypothetical protein